MPIPDQLLAALAGACIAYYAAITLTLLPLSMVPGLRKLLAHGKLLMSEHAVAMADARRRRRQLHNPDRRVSLSSSAGNAADPLTSATETDDGVSDGDTASSIVSVSTSNLSARHSRPSPNISGVSSPLASRVGGSDESDGDDKDASSTTAPPPRPSSDWLTQLLSLRVPKAWFVHFYWVALAMTAVLSAIISPARPLTLFGMHASRRLWEQRTFFPASASMMHSGHYLLGLTFYTVTPLAIALAVVAARREGHEPVVGFVLTSAFLGFNLSQCAHHYFLSVQPKPVPVPVATAAVSPRVRRMRSTSRPRGSPVPARTTAPMPPIPSLGSAPTATTDSAAAADSPTLSAPITPRRLRTNTMSSGISTVSNSRPSSSSLGTAKPASTAVPVAYKLPRRGLFKKVTCPHYLFEILIYASLFLMQPSRAMLACVVWVVANLTVSASQSHEYYRLVHGRTRKYRIFPGVY
ncbi:hypothetical protein BC828DRAFT_435818 [Blastocladiella britannica]|nr:hypothetical protein BC828DRAFT_435818 [Blastocladiella britannica]